MKKTPFLLMPLLAIFLSPLSFALDFTITDAQEVFKARGPEGEALKNAEKAASMFGDLYKEAVTQGKDVLDQTELLIAQSKALYYVADHAKDNNDKIAGHLQGKDVAMVAAKLLRKEGSPSEVKDPGHSRSLAFAYYWYGANMGKWGLANGILNSLYHWPEVRETMSYIEKLGEKDLEYYGANRVLGWAYFKLPFPMGDKNKSLALLEEANEQTLDASGEISNHGTNVLYYAQVLNAKGKTEKAKKILEKFIQVGVSADSLKEFNEERIPETVEEIAEAKRILENL